MRPIFCGNFEFDARPSDLERLFRRYGKVDKVDMKSGYAFVHMEDERDADYAIRALDRTEFGRKGRRLRVEWTKQERGGGKPALSARKSAANLKPSKTLFVINFPYHTKTSDLERHFERYGKIVNVRIRKNFAFVQYETQEDATKALDATNMRKMLDRVISVEYSARGDDDRRNDSNLDRRGQYRSPDRRRRSPSPYKRERGSPDYGTGSSPADYRRERGSPVYGRGSSPTDYRRERGSPVYGRGSTRSPRRVERGSLENNRVRSRSPLRRVRDSPEYRDRSRSPRGGERNMNRKGSLENDQVHNLCPLPRVRDSPKYPDRSRSPRGGERNGNRNGRDLSTSPYRRDEASPDRVRRPRGPVDYHELREAGELDETSPDLVRRPRSPVDDHELREAGELDEASPDRVRRPRSPVDDHELREAGELVSPMDDRYRSQSPLPSRRERSRSQS